MEALSDLDSTSLLDRVVIDADILTEPSGSDVMRGLSMLGTDDRLTDAVDYVRDR